MNLADGTEDKLPHMLHITLLHMSSIKLQRSPAITDNRRDTCAGVPL